MTDGRDAETDTGGGGDAEEREELKEEADDGRDRDDESTAEPEWQNMHSTSAQRSLDSKQSIKGYNSTLNNYVIVYLHWNVATL